MTKRKITLLIITAVLLVIAVLQGVLGNIDPVKTIKFDVEPDTLLIEGDNSAVKLTLHNGIWYVGDDNFQAKKTDVTSMINSVKGIRVLEKIGSASNEVLEERYALKGAKALTVTASKDGKVLRTVKVGKTSSTGSQSYITMDGKKEVYLVSGNYSSIFGKNENDLKSEYVYEEDGNDIINATVTKGNTSWGIVRSSKLKATPAVWSFAGAADGNEIDSDKADTWIQQIATLKVTAWLDENYALPVEKEATVTFQIGDNTTEVSVYKTGSGSSLKYIGTCNRTPHKFEINSFSEGKFTKSYEDLIKK